ncbi:MAG TPA: outer membrane beta-barrel protein [Burkholderiales bacterium]|nr:outer membrane beta-barrel protein [Burkholderiales bacterium]
MKKLLIASAVSAAFAAPATALAQQARVPTLSQVLDASGVSVSGYIDAGYSYANRNIGAPGGFTDRAFDSQNNSFSLHQFGLTVSKTPKEGFGGLVNITAGSDAQLIHSFPETTASTFDLTQAYGQYATGALTLMAGKFTTLAGTEVIASTGNLNFSRSILFTAVPLTHTGVRASYAPTDTITLYGGVNNGWDQLTDGNKGKTLELGATLNPLKPLTVTVTGYFGQESAAAGVAGAPGGTQTGTGPQGTRDMIDAVANYIISNSMSVGAEVLYVTQDNTAVGKAKYNGAAGYFTYTLNSQWRATARAEMFDDKNGFHFNTAPTGVKYREGTVTLAYMPTSSVELRGEVRRDQANNAVFVNSDGTTSKSLMTLGLQGIYKF